MIAASRARLETIAAVTRKASYRPRVFCMEWMDPVYCSGHWVPEMVQLAGGRDELAHEGAYSVRIAWEDVLRWAPEVLVVMPCGLDLKKTVAQAQQLVTARLPKSEQRKPIAAASCELRAASCEL